MKSVVFAILLFSACGRASAPASRESASEPTAEVHIKRTTPPPRAAKEPGAQEPKQHQLEASLAPLTPTLDAKGCPPGSQFLEEDYFTTQCLSNENPAVRLAVMHPSNANSTMLSILVFSSEQQTSYGYLDGYITTLKVCRSGAEALCVETFFAEKGVRTYETTIRDGSGVYMTSFHPNGNKAAEGPLRSEGKVGHWTYYDIEGTKTREEEHADDGKLAEP